MAGKRKGSRSNGRPSGDDVDRAKKQLKVDDEEERESVNDDGDVDTSVFIGDPFPDDVAQQRWPHRYPPSSSSSSSSEGKGDVSSAPYIIGDGTGNIILAKKHYSMAEVDGIVYKLDDDAHVQAPEGTEDFICKVVELFEAKDGSRHFTAQWYYRSYDTVIKDLHEFIDKKRVFISEVRDDNMLNALVRKVVIVRLPLHVDNSARKATISNCDFYCDTEYLIPYASFVKLPIDVVEDESDSGSTISVDGDTDGVNSDTKKISDVGSNKREEMSLLDLYSGCGAMSTGLCLGATTSGVNLVTKWAVDINPDACLSLKYNHPHTEVRNEPAGDFLNLLKEWKNLCVSFNLMGGEEFQQNLHEEVNKDNEVEDNAKEDNKKDYSVVFEVEKIVAICFGDPNKKVTKAKATKEKVNEEKTKGGLYFKIRWKGYGEKDDTWEPIDGLSGCKAKIKEFLSKSLKSKLLPLPGSVDVICGGPPCQGISGFNRHRNAEKPLDDPKNQQLVVFMDIVEYLKPRFVLMENVVDIVKFAGGYLGRYALSRLVGMNYQSRLGMMVAGCYGLPQFRMRAFMWGALPTENLPQYPLPSHNVVVRGGVPQEFEACLVACEAENRPKLEKELVLRDAISDLPIVANDEQRDEMPYIDEPVTDFQKFIRLRKDVFPGSAPISNFMQPVLFDHRPLKLNDDDYLRVCEIPKKKGANYRDMKGVKIGADNVAMLDPDVERVLLPSKNHLVPDYAITFCKGKSSKPFGRLWWDETVPTVVTRAEPHNQVVMHPEQDRVLSVRENARLQGFPDHYKLFGSIKERYIQVGNAVAVPVSRVLGYALGLAVNKSSGDGPLLTLPRNYPNHIVENSQSIDYDI